MKADTESLLNPEFLQQYAIVGRETDFESALQNGGKVAPGGVISIKSSASGTEKHKSPKENHGTGKKRGRDSHGGKSDKKRKS